MTTRPTTLVCASIMQQHASIPIAPLGALAPEILDRSLQCGRPHMALGRGVPDRPVNAKVVPEPSARPRAENRTSSAPNQSLAGCVMNIRSQLLARDRFFADDKGSDRRPTASRSPL